ncbi:MAG: DnaK suppressor protein [Candidatus Omnitrophota bacterium]|jgi:DnaK suppressor protein
MAMLSNEEKVGIKAEILRRKSEAEQSAESLLEQVKPVSPDSSIGRITRMDAIQQKSVAEANLLNANETILSLTEALKNLDNPSFGICILCQKPIAIERVLALPQSKKCVHCA